MTLRNGLVDFNVSGSGSSSEGAIVTITGGYAVPKGVGTVKANAAGGAIAITFAPTSLNNRQKVTFIKTDATQNAVTISDGVAVVEGLNLQNQGVTLQSDAAAGQLLVI